MNRANRFRKFAPTVMSLEPRLFLDGAFGTLMAGCAPSDPTLIPAPMLGTVGEPTQIIIPPPTWEPGDGMEGDWGPPNIPNPYSPIVPPFPGEGLPPLDPPSNPVGPVVPA